jgi:hypothetical protein
VSALCPECARLLDDLKAENHVIADIHRLQFQAAINNDSEAWEALKPHLLRVRKRRQSAVEALKRHLGEH